MITALPALLVATDDLGRYDRAITTTSPRAQAYFDQGLRLVHGFRRSTRASVARGPGRT